MAYDDDDAAVDASDYGDDGSDHLLSDTQTSSSGANNKKTAKHGFRVHLHTPLLTKRQRYGLISPTSLNSIIHSWNLSCLTKTAVPAHHKPCTFKWIPPHMRDFLQIILFGS